MPVSGKEANSAYSQELVDYNSCGQQVTLLHVCLTAMMYVVKCNIKTLHFADMSSEAGSSESGRSRSVSPSSLHKPAASFCCPALVKLAPKPYARPQAKLRLVPAPARCANAALTVLSRGTSTAKFSAWASCKACRKYVSNQLFSCPATSSDHHLGYGRLA